MSTPLPLVIAPVTAITTQPAWLSGGASPLGVTTANAATNASISLGPPFSYRTFSLLPAATEASWRLSDNLASLFSAFWDGYVLATYSETIQWCQAINENTPGATNTETFDVRRRYATTFTDGSFGVGWQAPYPPNGKIYKGYFPAQLVGVAINDRATTQRIQEAGKVTYTSPRIYFMPPVALQKGDLIVRLDGTRCIVADVITPAQVMGITIVSSAELETRTRVDPVYQVSLI